MISEKLKKIMCYLIKRKIKQSSDVKKLTHGLYVLWYFLPAKQVSHAASDVCDVFTWYLPSIHKMQSSSEAPPCVPK
jgi:hypothetical protein